MSATATSSIATTQHRMHDRSLGESRTGGNTFMNLAALKATEKGEKEETTPNTERFHTRAFKNSCAGNFSAFDKNRNLKMPKAAA